MIPWLGPDDPFPPLAAALQEPNGLLAAGAALDPTRLVDAYSRGIFPWSSEGQPLLWWSPDPRMVLWLDEFRISRSLRKRLRSVDLETRVDTSFERVIAACAEPRRGQDGTWITSDMQRAYCALFALGYAHSVETWRDESLVGGLYGVSLGRVFFGESMFAREDDASKVALVALVQILRSLGVPIIDCQQETHHLASMGARPVPRPQFAGILHELIHSMAPPGGWPRGRWAGAP